MLRQPRHGENIARQRYNKARTGRDTQLADRDAESRWTPELGLIIREGLLRLGHADRHLVEAELSELLGLLLGVAGEHHAVSAVDLGGDLVPGWGGDAQAFDEGGTGADRQGFNDLCLRKELW